MSRLEAGKAEPHREPIDLAEVLDAARETVAEPELVRLALDPRPAAGRAPTPPSSSAPSPTCSRTRSATAAAGRSWSSRGWSVTRSRSRGRPGPGHPGERVAADLRAVPARRGGGARAAPASGWRSPRASSRPTAARSRSSRCPARAAASSSRLPGREERALSDGARILVCDDEPQILRALKVILRDAGYEAVPAASGEEALDRAAVKPPAAAIVDLMLPDIDGVEVTKRLREWSEMPIIVLSAVGEEEAKVRALAAGADDYVTKPFGPPELVARLRGRAAPGRRRRRGADGRGRRARDRPRRAQRPSRRRGGPPDADRVRAAAHPGPQPRPADDPPRPADRGLGRGVRRRPRSCAPTSPTCARKIEPADGPRYIRTDPGVGYRFAA